MKNPVLKFTVILVFLLLAFAIVWITNGDKILKLYIKTGVGDCKSIPILCTLPAATSVPPAINESFKQELLPYKFPSFSISVPRNFEIIQEEIKKVYYKKNKRMFKGATIYLLHENPNFFTGLFPQLKEAGITDDYQFIERTMYANIEGIKDISDAFFVIIKGVFTPDLGDQKHLKMVKFAWDDKKGFINYNLEKENNYFDCNVFNGKGDFFKIYIKDKGASLDFDKVMTIISTVNTETGL